MYNPSSNIATEFIDHNEILDSIKSATEKSADIDYVNSLLEKASMAKGL